MKCSHCNGVRVVCTCCGKVMNLPYDGEMDSLRERLAWTRSFAFEAAELAKAAMELAGGEARPDVVRLVEHALKLARLATGDR